ncbi:MAG: hypothetical protein FWF03_04710, partial [Defluviitaleaceae bacterium]|nr:hypothetical protein [Defluviitaleaceae bacterium]
ELRDKIKTCGESYDDAQSPDDGQFGRLASVGSSSERKDALDALLALGYGRSESLKAVVGAACDGMGAEAIVRGALRLLSKT